MTEPTTGAEALSPVKRALLEIRDLKAQLARLTGDSASAPVVGSVMGAPGTRPQVP